MVLLYFCSSWFFKYFLTSSVFVIMYICSKYTYLVSSVWVISIQFIFLLKACSFGSERRTSKAVLLWMGMFIFFTCAVTVLFWAMKDDLQVSPTDNLGAWVRKGMTAIEWNMDFRMFFGVHEMLYSQNLGFWESVMEKTWSVFIFCDPCLLLLSSACGMLIIKHGQCMCLHHRQSVNHLHSMYVFIYSEVIR